MKKDQKTDFLSARVRYIPINDIRPNPQQPRRRFDSESLQELAASIAAYGILQPITVRQQGAVYELVASLLPSGSWPPATIRSSPASAAGGRRGSPGCGRCPVCWPGWMRRTPPCWP